MKCRLMAEGASYELTEKSLASVRQKKKKKAAVTPRKAVAVTDRH